MLVLRQNAAGVSESPQGTIYPADRCTWIQADSATGNGYTLMSANYLSFDTHVPLGNDVDLGIIGKSGRFVALTNAT